MKKLNGKWLLMLLLIPVVYIVFQLFVVLNDSYVTEPAMLYTLADKIDCAGILGMEETPIVSDAAGVVSYKVANGERVTAGTVVADVFASAADAQASAYAAQLDAEIAVLEKMQLGSSGADVEMLLRQSYTNLYKILSIADSRQYAELIAARQEFQLVLGKTDLATGKAADYSARIAELQAKRAEAAAKSPVSQILSPVSGYFADGENSKKQLYNTETLQQMTPSALQEATSAPSPENGSEVAGKVIHDYKWRFFTVVSLKEAVKFETADRYNPPYLSFPEYSAEEFPTTVVSITKDEENGIAKIELLCDYINENVVLQATAQASIRFLNYEGLRVDKRALRIVDGQNGVYVKKGNMAFFKPISILFENENYLLVSNVQEPGVNELALYDAVIVKGKNLSDGKIL